MKAIPEDFRIHYKWREGSVPPPHHYEYSISVGPGGAGRIVFLPDYPSENPPAWTETFNIDEERLNALYVLMADKDVFRKHWTEIEDPPVGSALEWLEITAEGENFLVPSAIEETDVVGEVYPFIKALVPRKIWDKLLSQREQYRRGRIG